MTKEEFKKILKEYTERASKTDATVADKMAVGVLRHLYYTEYRWVKND